MDPRINGWMGGSRMGSGQIQRLPNRTITSSNCETAKLSTTDGNVALQEESTLTHPTARLSSLIPYSCIR
ncbi:hypothetical protein EGR_07146 [Echinococcus granulosus]|uniref:Uncharacterized protein n=1 Tax=Echinococcus granulosus TaxID=6210 RepID=W6UAE3_ECHGR|nr:hypothetical protein EGR_07146 [Echinococcus granulosus]EUB58040.1 hypothetical protein EGR_07146 [Echinococcus granulosus]